MPTEALTPAPPPTVSTEEETVFSTRIPEATHRRLRFYCHNSHLFIQDVVTSLVTTWLDAPVVPPEPETRMREEKTFSARIPLATATRLSDYCFNAELKIQDVVTYLVETWLDAEGAPLPPLPRRRTR